MIHARKTIASPVGALTLVASRNGLVAILWENDRPGRVRLPETIEVPDDPIIEETEHQLAAYFAGSLRTFSVPLDLMGTDFQKKVWTALLTIPFGETRTYAEVAQQIGHATAFRAMGAANGRNPVSIIVPCHRTIGSDGGLHGFAGGLETKRYLLDLEQTYLRTAA